MRKVTKWPGICVENKTKQDKTQERGRKFIKILCPLIGIRVKKGRLESLRGGYEKTQANAKGKVGFKMEPPAAAGFEERMQRP